MTRLIVKVLCLFAPTAFGAVGFSGLDYEDKLLQKIVEAYQIEPHKPERPSFGALERLGRALFFDPIISGPENVACATCHLRSNATVDGLRMPVGIGGSGVGRERLSSREAFVVQRNVLPLFNRGKPVFRAFFWDGSVQLSEAGRLESGLGEKLPTGFESAIAVAAIFPIISPDEMLGRNTTHAGEYAGFLTRDDMRSSFQDRSQNVFPKVVDRLLGLEKKNPTPAQVHYRQLFYDAFGNETKLTIASVGNALAAYIRVGFELESAPWDQYVEGEVAAMTRDQKRGAILFFGKGRCAVCHSGTEFSDFLFHGLAIPQLNIGKHGAYVDYGRAAATSRSVDRYAFRTAPLRNVTETGPWGHNGIFGTLEEVVEHHSNPVPALYTAQQDHPEEGRHSGRLLGHRSPILAEVGALSSSEIDLLVVFLSALRSRAVLPDSIAIPATVPSGKNEFAIH